MSAHETVFAQQGYRCRLDWGRRGAQAAAERGDVLVVVDVLSFSSAVATALHHGGIVYPCATAEDAAALARDAGAEIAVARGDVPTRGRFSLSPVTYQGLEPGARIVLPSSNGAPCIRCAPTVPHRFVAALLNAEAVAAAVASVLETSDLCVTVLACGERWAKLSDDGALRFAVEDHLGAGAVLSYLRHEKSPEARTCEGAFCAVRDELPAVLWECGSGRELRERGHGEDVRHAARLNLYRCVPRMREERLEDQNSGSWTARERVR